MGVGVKHLGTREREGLKECGNEDEPTLQEREANNDQERKLKKGNGKKKYPTKKKVPNVRKEIK